MTPVSAGYWRRNLLSLICIFALTLAATIAATGSGAKAGQNERQQRGKINSLAIGVGAAIVGSAIQNASQSKNRSRRDNRRQRHGQSGPKKCPPGMVRGRKGCACKRGFRKVGRICLPKKIIPQACPKNAKRRGRICVCLKGFKKARGGICVGITPPAPRKCPAHARRRGKLCVCNRGYKQVGRGRGMSCVRPEPPKCPKNMTFKGKSCVCKRGYEPVRKGRRIIRCERPKPPSCPDNAYRHGKSCACKRGYAPVRKGKRLIRCERPKPPSCPDNAYRLGKSCACKRGYEPVRRGKRLIRCVRPGPICKYPKVSIKGGKACGCAKGFIAIGKGRALACVRPPKPVKCDWPEVRARGGKTCVCAKGYRRNSRNNRCERPTPPPSSGPDCRWPEVSTRSGKSCKCARGYERKGRYQQCRRIVEVAPPVAPPVTPPVTPPAGEPVDVGRIQDCLHKAGFDPGPVDGSAGRQTLRAFGAFQRSQGLRRTGNLRDRRSRRRLFARCKDGPKVVKPPKPVAPSPVEVISQPTAASISPLRQDNCLDPDLLKLIEETYGVRPNQPACQPACIAKPAHMSEQLLDDLASKHDIEWCEECVKIRSYLPLNDILRIEKAANIQLCAAPQDENLCRLPASSSSVASGETRTIVKTRVRTILKHLPPRADHRGDVAVIIGNETYEHLLKANVNGVNDAVAMRTLLTEHLGYREQNILQLENTGLADLQRVFGTDEQPGELARLLKKNGSGDVFVYISSHGAALRPGEDLLSPASVGDDKSRASYILPVDARNDRTADTAYPLSRLYERLGQLKARSVVVALEASFTPGLSERIVPPNLPVDAVNAGPQTPVPGLVVLKASERDQRTLEDPQLNIGLFTRYLIEGYGGQADSDRFGRRDGRVDSVELYAYVAQNVVTASRKSFGLKQKPILFQIENLVVGSLSR